MSNRGTAGALPVAGEIGGRAADLVAIHRRLRRTRPRPRFCACERAGQTVHEGSTEGRPRRPPPHPSQELPPLAESARSKGRRAAARSPRPGSGSRAPRPVLPREGRRRARRPSNGAVRASVRQDAPPYPDARTASRPPTLSQGTAGNRRCLSPHDLQETPSLRTPQAVKLRLHVGPSLEGDERVVLTALQPGQA